MKRYFKLLPVFIFFVLGACNSKSDKNILSKDQMSKILAQLHLAEAFVNANYSYSDSSRYIYKKMEDSLLQANNLPRAVFDSSLNHYKKNPKELDEVYAVTVDSLSLKEGLAK